jgi:hypothetical protein
MLGLQKYDYKVAHLGCRAKPHELITIGMMQTRAKKEEANDAEVCFAVRRSTIWRNANAFATSLLSPLSLYFKTTSNAIVFEILSKSDELMSKICTMRKVPFTCGYHIT